MSEAPKRTIAQIQQEYQDLSMRVGHTQYQVYTLQKDVELMNQALRDLNIEAGKLKQEEEAAAKAAAAPALADASLAAEAPVKKDDN